MDERRRRWPQPRLLAALLPLLLISSGCATASFPPDAHTYRNDSAAVLLELHNRERLAVGSPLLRWDPTLAADAAGYAAYLAARGGDLRHSARSQRPGQGENLWMGTRGAFSVQAMSHAWSAERANFRAGTFPAVSRTGNWADVGHYSQMIWPTTTRLGCAIAGGARHDVLVCRYAPAGNIDGRSVP